MERLKGICHGRFIVYNTVLTAENDATAIKKGRSHPISQLLDEAINELYKLSLIEEVG